MSPNGDPTSMDLLVVLTRVETKLDAVMGTQTDHEDRIRTLERSRWPLPSIAALIGVCGVAISTYNMIARGQG